MDTFNPGTFVASGVLMAVGVIMCMIAVYVARVVFMYTFRLFAQVVMIVVISMMTHAYCNASLHACEMSFIKGDIDMLYGKLMNSTSRVVEVAMEMLVPNR